jgi:hypothetical protein
LATAIVNAIHTFLFEVAWNSDSNLDAAFSFYRRLVGGVAELTKGGLMYTYSFMVYVCQFGENACSQEAWQAKNA